MARMQIEMGMSTTPRAPIQSGIEIRIGDVDLATKLDALGAAVREAHRDTISTRGWAALHRAQEAIAEAMMDSRKTIPSLLTSDSADGADEGSAVAPAHPLNPCNPW